MGMLGGVVLGVLLWFVVRCLLMGVYTVDQNERAVKTSFGRAERIGKRTSLDDPSAQSLNEEERGRYCYPQVRVIPPGGPYFKLPWQKIYKVSIATQTVSIGYDPEDAGANSRGEVLEAVTKDQLNTGLRGQLRFAVSERNLYAYLFGIRNPIAHVMGFFISVLRERVANFEAPPPLTAPEAATGTSGSVQGISINDLRKNLSEINRHMEQECRSSVARYGILLDAALITEITPPNEVESALAAINTAHNQVSSEISLAQAGADQKIVQSRKAVEIETLRAQAEVQLLNQLSDQLTALQMSGGEVLQAYLRNVRLNLYQRAKRIVLEERHG